MLLLIRNLPSDSAFQAAYRDDWALQEQLSTGILNEIKAMRGDLWALIGHQHLPFKPVLPPGSERAQAARTRIVRTAHDELVKMMRGSGKRR
jgi:hypothetical protein